MYYANSDKYDGYEFNKNIKEIGKMDWNKVKEFIIMLMDQDMKVHGIMTTKYTFEINI